MKRLVAILLLALLLFNAFGYYALFALEQRQARRQQIVDLPESAFIVLKSAMPLYAHSDDPDFEYVEGLFTKDGQTYNMVKRRIMNDSLEVYCLRNVRHDLMTAQFNDYVQEQFALKNTIPASSNPTKMLLKSFLKDYLPNADIKIVRCTQITEGSKLAVKMPILDTAILTAGHFSIHSPPPNVA